MQLIIYHPAASAVWADALFASGLQRCDEPSASQVRQAVAESIRAFGYSGCAGRVAQEFGDHPETAVARMRWARAAAGEAFAESAPQPGRRTASLVSAIFLTLIPIPFALHFANAPESSGAGILAEAVCIWIAAGLIWISYFRQRSH